MHGKTEKKITLICIYVCCHRKSSGYGVMVRKISTAWLILESLNLPCSISSTRSVTLYIEIHSQTERFATHGKLAYYLTSRFITISLKKISPRVNKKFISFWLATRSLFTCVIVHAPINLFSLKLQSKSQIIILTS